MLRTFGCLLAFFGMAVLLSGALTGQEPQKEDPKVIKKDDPLPKVKGVLPANWGKLGLTVDQRQRVYTIQNKYGAEIDLLTAKIAQLKATRDQEMKDVLSPEQKKRLEDILLGKKK
jgi:hypothetical protein